MIGAGIHSGDLLVVDRSLEPKNGNVIVAALDGDLTVKRLYQRNGVIRLFRKIQSIRPLRSRTGSRSRFGEWSQRHSSAVAMPPASPPVYALVDCNNFYAS